jgi:hypothetical protein
MCKLRVHVNHCAGDGRESAGGVPSGLLPGHSTRKTRQSSYACSKKGVVTTSRPRDFDW